MSGLSEQLRAGTAQAHRRAESTVFMRQLMAGQAGRVGYAALLQALHPIYIALEAALRKPQAREALAPMWQAGWPGLPQDLRLLDHLARAGAIEQDLKDLLDVQHPSVSTPAAGPDPGVNSVALSALSAPAVPLSAWQTGQAYAAHLHALADEPHLLGAHVYLRYLGDLYGGQLMARALEPSWHLPAGRHATRFLDFGTPGQVRAAMAALRSALDALRLSDSQQQAVVQEACSGFARHEAIFEGLVLSPSQPATPAGGPDQDDPSSSVGSGPGLPNR